MGFLPVGALPGIVIPLRLRQQGFYRGNANYGSALSAKPLLTSCSDDGVAIGFSVGGSSLHPQHLEYIVYRSAMLVNTLPRAIFDEFYRRWPQRAGDGLNYPANGRN